MGTRIGEEVFGAAPQGCNTQYFGAGTWLTVLGEWNENMKVSKKISRQRLE